MTTPTAQQELKKAKELLRRCYNTILSHHGEGGVTEAIDAFLSTPVLDEDEENDPKGLPRTMALNNLSEASGLIKFPKITASSANAIAYQLEIGRENHSCPVDDKTIAEWLRDLANQLDPEDRKRGNDGSNYPIKSKIN